MDGVEAREKMFIPIYRKILEKKILPSIQNLHKIAQQRDIVR